MSAYYHSNNDNEISLSFYAIGFMCTQEVYSSAKYSIVQQGETRRGN